MQMRRITTGWIGWALLLALALPAQAQRNLYVRTALMQQGPETHHEAFAVPAKGESDLVIAYRIPYSRLVFVRVSESFVSETNLTASLYRNGALVEEKIWPVRVTVSAFEETKQRDADVIGQIVFRVPPGLYGYRLRLGEQLLTTPVPSVVEVPDFGRLTVGDAVMVDRIEWEEGLLLLHPANLGGNVPFGQGAQVAVPVGLPEGHALEKVRLRYRLLRLNPQEVAREEERRARAYREYEPLRGRENEVFDPGWLVQYGQTVRAGELGMEALFPITARVATEAPVTMLQRMAPEQAAGYVALLDLDGMRLEEGTYMLETTVETGTDGTSRRTRFQTYWRDKPIGLLDPDLAIQLLSFLEEAETVRLMQRGRKAQREARLRTYWAERDPTPGTVFNELMAEYYRRIDYAAAAFRSGASSVPDGLTSDRARVYVLQGPPAEIEREFPERGGVREVWLYNDGRTFVFEALSAFDTFDLVASGS